jgi:hypothetical protein
MKTLIIKDLSMPVEWDRKAMAAIHGGIQIFKCGDIPPSLPTVPFAPLPAKIPAGYPLDPFSWPSYYPGFDRGLEQ